MKPKLFIGPRTLLNDCNHSAFAIFRGSAKSTQAGRVVCLNGFFRVEQDRRLSLQHACT